MVRDTAAREKGNYIVSEIKTITTFEMTLKNKIEYFVIKKSVFIQST